MNDPNRSPHSSTQRLAPLRKARAGIEPPPCRDDTFGLVSRAMGRLSYEQRRVLFMAIAEKKTSDDLACAMGISRLDARRQLRAARVALISALETEGKLTWAV